MIDAIANTSNTMTRSRSPATIAVDNFLRKALRISDPRDPEQIASALLARYPAEAEKNRREQSGLPYSTLPEYVPPAGAGGATSTEIVQAQDDLERDLHTLATESQLKDIRIETIGWGRAVRKIVSDGLAAARLALDPVQEGRALSARRALVEYARLARFVGSLSEASGVFFRDFAQSCDVLAGLILVAIGEGFATSGITRSTNMVRASSSELQSRAHGVIMALRSLKGTFDTPLGQDDLPRGMEAYRQLGELLDLGGLPDLAGLLEESTLSETLNDLIDLSTGTSVDSLRELATQASTVVPRLERLIAVASGLLAERADDGLDSPPLRVFISALQLFVDAFAPKDSSRLLFVARPPIIVGGLYGISGDGGALRLQLLTNMRGTIAAQIEDRAGCGCDTAKRRTELLLDYLLFNLDRAIDLQAAGATGTGDAEKRAAAAGLIIDGTLRLSTSAGLLFNSSLALETNLKTVATELLKDFRSAGGWASAEVQAFVGRELLSLFDSEETTERLVRRLTSGTNADVFDLPSTAIVVPLPTGSTPRPATGNLSLVRTTLAEILWAELNIAVEDADELDLTPTTGQTLAIEFPRLVDVVEEINDKIPALGGGGPTSPGSGGGTGPAGPAIAAASTFASMIFGPNGGLNLKLPETDWIQELPGAASLDGAQLRELVGRMTRDDFVTQMQAASKKLRSRLTLDLDEAELEALHWLLPQMKFP